MSKDSFSKLVPNTVDPKLWPNPTNISLVNLQKYVSLDQVKINYSIKNYKKSIGYLSGILVGCFIVKVYMDKYVKQQIFGENGNGGTILKMATYNSIGDYSYNRQFQRMRYLSEQPAGDDANLNCKDELLVDLGIDVKPLGLNRNILKRAPHDKYLI